MIYREYALPEVAKAAALCAWRVELEEGDPDCLAHSIVPDGTTNLAVAVGPDDVRHSHLVGPGTAAQTVAIAKGWCYAGLRLRPHSAFWLTGTEPAEMVGRSTGDFPARDRLEPLIEALARTEEDWPGDGEWTRCLAGYAPADPPIAAEVDRIIRLGGAVRLAECAARCGLEERQFRRRFLAATGLAPKSFASVQRLRRTCILTLTEACWAGLAQMSGFADQPHMNRAMSVAFGMPPTAIGGYLGTIRHIFLAQDHDRYVQDGIVPTA